MRGFFASGGSTPTQEGGDSSGLSEALGDIGALLTAVVAEMRNFCSRDTLKALQVSAGRSGGVHYLHIHCWRGVSAWLG